MSTGPVTDAQRPPLPAVSAPDAADTAHRASITQDGLVHLQLKERIRTGPEFWVHGVGEFSAEVQTGRGGSIWKRIAGTATGSSRAHLVAPVIPAQFEDLPAGVQQVFQRHGQVGGWHLTASSFDEAQAQALEMSKAAYLDMVAGSGMRETVAPFAAILVDDDGTHYSALPVVDAQAGRLTEIGPRQPATIPAGDLPLARFYLQPGYDDTVRGASFTRRSPSLLQLDGLFAEANFRHYDVGDPVVALTRLGADGGEMLSRLARRGV